MALGKLTSIQRGQLDRDLHSPKSMVMKYFSTFCKRGVRKCIRRTVTSVVVLLVWNHCSLLQAGLCFTGDRSHKVWGHLLCVVSSTEMERLVEFAEEKRWERHLCSVCKDGHDLSSFTFLGMWTVSKLWKVLRHLSIKHMGRQVSQLSWASFPELLGQMGFQGQKLNPEFCGW